MHTHSFASSTRLLVATLVAATLVALGGCGSGINGTYTGVPGQSIFEKIELQSGGKVLVTFVGVLHEATYTMNGSSIVINNQGQLTEFKIDSNGCLLDPLGGKYCRGGTSTANQAPATPAAGGALSGTYEARIPDGSSYAITFQSGGKARCVMSEGGTSETREATYELRGDQVTVRISDEMPLQLTRNGNALEQTMGGITIRFTRK